MAKNRLDPRQARLEWGLGLAALAAGLLGSFLAVRIWKRYTRRQAVRQQRMVRKERAAKRSGGQPCPGDILLFFRPARGRDYIIRWLTRSPFYHAALYADSEGAGHVIEARPQGVIYNSLEGREQNFVVVPAPEDKGGKALAWARTQLGAAYDHMDPLTILLEHIFVRWHINYVPKGRYTCAEFVATAYDHAGVRLVPEHGLDGIDPGDIANHLLPHPLSKAL